MNMLGMLKELTISIRKMVKAVIYAFVAYILYFPLREIGVKILHALNIGVIYYSYNSDLFRVLGILFMAFVLTVLLFFLYYRGERTKYYSGLVLSTLPILTGNLVYLILPALLMISNRLKDKRIFKFLIMFVFFQWIIVTIAISVPNQSYIEVSENMDKVFVFTHGLKDSLIMHQGEEIFLEELVVEKGWEDKKFYIFACHGSNVCSNYEYCGHVPEINGIYVPQLTFFIDVFYAGFL